MISYVKGQLAEVTADGVIVECGGIGYEIFMSNRSLEQLLQGSGEVKIHTYFSVKEDGQKLFGFLSKEELKLFRLLLGVNGIGPKGGLQILSKLSPSALQEAVLTGDVKAISSAQGIGKKTAEKLILELKDKFFITAGVFQKEGAVEQAESGAGGIREEVIQALTALGYGSTEARMAVTKVEMAKESTVESVLKEALRHL